MVGRDHELCGARVTDETHQELASKKTTNRKVVGPLKYKNQLLMGSGNKGKVKRSGA